MSCTCNEKDLKLIVLSSPDPVPEEHELIHKLFEGGMSCLHLRKPGSSEKEVSSWLDRIDRCYHNRIVVHSHYGLVERYTLKGIHLTERDRIAYAAGELSVCMHNMENRGMTISTSVHQRRDFSTLSERFNYTFFSPVFPSISKPGYDPKGNMYVSDISSAHTVIGLGGIHVGNVMELPALGYKGAALLGVIWKEPEKAVKNFSEIQQCITKGVPV